MTNNEARELAERYVIFMADRDSECYPLAENIEVIHELEARLINGESVVDYTDRLEEIIDDCESDMDDAQDLLELFDELMEMFEER